MPTIRQVRPIVLTVVLAAAAWAVVGGAEPRQQPAARPNVAPITKPTPLPPLAGFDPAGARYLGAGNCAPCHSAPGNRGYEDRFGFLQMTEHGTWSQHDKHSFAYLALEGERGKRMGDILQTEVTKDHRCLSCHAIDIPAEAPRGSLFKIQDGVSCEGCHGPAERWLAPHLEPNSWRYADPATKATYGMRDVRDPAKRAQLCNSCHIGDLDQGRYVTHEMYAAGHPPLPGIELATFSHDEPNHWFLLRQKSEPVRSELREYLKLDTDSLEHTKLAMIGAAVGLRDAMERLADQAEASQKAERPEDQVLDLANFDCYACHHALKKESWRQRRPPSGAPGRPNLPAWPSALLEVALGHVGQDPDSFGPPTARLRKLFDVRPYAYGLSTEVAAAAREVARAADSLAARLAEARYDQAAGRKLFRELCALPVDRTLDYDSARQVAWAATILYEQDLDPKPAAHEAIQAALDAIATELKLDLPSGRARQIEDDLPEALRRIADYDPERVRAHFRTILDHLAPQPGPAGSP